MGNCIGVRRKRVGASDAASSTFVPGPGSTGGLAIRLLLTGGYGCISNMKSPCNQICEIDPPTGFCTGCGRTLDEIEEWLVATSERKQQILAVLPGRIAAIGEGLASAASSQLGVKNLRN